MAGPPVTVATTPPVVLSTAPTPSFVPELVPGPDPREQSIAAWLAGPLSGGDNDAAAARGARIVSKGEGYALTIDNQFKFTCNLDFDDTGTPKTLRGCVSGRASEGWTASPQSIGLHCTTASGYQTCAGAYRLKNGSMDNPGLFSFSRKASGTSATIATTPPPPPLVTAPTVTPTAPPPAGTRTPADIQRVIGAARGRFRACYDKGLAQDPGLTGKIPLTIVIGTDGKVTAASVGNGATLSSPVVTTCVLAVSRSLVFPASSDSSTVNYPLIFSSSKD